MAIRKLITAGERFGRLTILEEADPNQKTGQRRAYARCDCGTISDYNMAQMRSGHTSSCGCYNKERKIRHGHARSTTYQSWVSMKTRCTPGHGHTNYISRGITVCKKWIDSFDAFLNDMGERPKGTTIDRIDNSKGYAKDNCRWATASQQANNRRNSHTATAFGRTQTLMEWSKETGIPFQTIRHRKLRGWTDEKAVSA